MEPVERTELSILSEIGRISTSSDDLHRKLQRIIEVVMRGIGKDGAPREVYVYHIVDNAWSMREFGHQAVVWQTAVMPAVAIELMATGQWMTRGGVGPEALPSEPFLDLLDQHVDLDRAFGQGEVRLERREHAVPECSLLRGLDLGQIERDRSSDLV